MRYSLIAANMLFEVNIKDHLGFAISEAVQQVIMDKLKRRG